MPKTVIHLYFGAWFATNPKKIWLGNHSFAPLRQIAEHLAVF